MFERTRVQFQATAKIELEKELCDDFSSSSSSLVIELSFLPDKSSSAATRRNKMSSVFTSNFLIGTELPQLDRQPRHRHLPAGCKRGKTTLQWANHPSVGLLPFSGQSTRHRGTSTPLIRGSAQQQPRTLQHLSPYNCPLQP